MVVTNFPFEHMIMYFRVMERIVKEIQMFLMDQPWSLLDLFFAFSNINTTFQKLNPGLGFELINCLN